MPSQSDLCLGQVGVAYAQDGSNPPFRQGKSAEMSVSQLQAPYFEQTYRGNLFILDSGSQTCVAASAAGQAMGTAKFLNGFFNPTNSGKNAVLVGANVATTSGTPGGPLLYEVTAGAGTITSAATGTIRSGLIGGAAKSLMTPQVMVTLTALDADTTALVQIGTCGGPAAIAAGAGVYSCYDFIDGKIIIPPGYAFGICDTATGTSHVVQTTLYWIEVAV
jgi:hypothetical protein